jgi:hypothetical protein
LPVPLAVSTSLLTSDVPGLPRSRPASRLAIVVVLVLGLLALGAYLVLGARGTTASRTPRPALVRSQDPPVETVPPMGTTTAAPVASETATALPMVTASASAPVVVSPRSKAPGAPGSAPVAADKAPAVVPGAPNLGF